MLVMIEDVNLEPALRAHQRRQKSDRTGAGHQQSFRLPRTRALTDPLAMIPGRGDHAGRFEQNRGLAKCRVDLDQKFRLDAKILRAKSVPLLDAALGVESVAAHIPFADSARWTRHRIG